MIEIIPGITDTVIAVNVTGKLTGEDYKSVLIPAVEDLLTRQKKIRLLCRFEDNVSFSGSALWQDAALGLKNIAKWEKVAIVTDTDWLRQSTRFFSVMLPGEVKVFTGDQLEEAKTWIAA